MPEYTPGPWEAVKINTGHFVRQKDGERGYICQTRNNPNAKLIAAAPEMYEALDTCLMALFEAKDQAESLQQKLSYVIAGGSTYGAEMLSNIHIAIIEGEKALAKAEGRRG